MVRNTGTAQVHFGSSGNKSPKCTLKRTTYNMLYLSTNEYLSQDKKKKRAQMNYVL
uniref:Uncharacterized protein n=1 Tax=Anguilla anguilla TaxID=7936 RepID=A0A0E9TXZ2_ANGAN